MHPLWLTWLLRLIVLALPSVGATLALQASLPAIIDAAAARHWTPVQAQLDWVQDSTESNGQGSSPFLIEVRYRYRLGERTYSSRQLSFDAHLPSSRRGQRERYAILIAAQQRGAEVAAWADPANPQRAVLYRDLGIAVYFVAAVGFALLVVLGVSLWVMRPRRSAPRA